jgi:transposase
MNAAPPRLTGLPVAPAKPVPENEEEYGRAWRDFRRSEGWSNRKPQQTGVHVTGSREETAKLILAKLDVHPDSTAAQIARTLDMHHSTVATHLHRLWMQGRVDRVRTHKHKPFIYDVKEKKT